MTDDDEDDDDCEPAGNCCSACGGEGWVDDPDDPGLVMDCPACDGTGNV